MIRIAGGEDSFPERAVEPLAKARILADPGRCGAALARYHPGLVVRQEVPPGNGELYEVKSPAILQSGPAALSDGAGEIARIVHAWSEWP